MAPSRWILQPPVAFVFSGGASHAASQVGMLRAVMEAGIQPDLLVGCSAGALNAAFLAADPTSAGAARLELLWRTIKRETIFPGNPARLLLRLATGQSSLYSDAALRSFVRKTFSDGHFAGLRLPLGVLATRIPSGMPFVFTQGALEPALLATTAIPGVLPWVDIDGERYVDGSVVSAVPLVPAQKLGAASYVVFDAGPPCGVGMGQPGIASLLSGIVNVATRQRIASQLPEIAKTGRVVYLAAPCPGGLSPLDFSQSQRLIQGGYDATVAQLKTGWDAGPGYVGAPHFHDNATLAQSWGITPASPESEPRNRAVSHRL